MLGECVKLDWRLVEEGAYVKIDPSQFNQILVNLCVNAADAIAGCGTITIETRSVTVRPDQYPDNADAAAGDYVMLSVADTRATGPCW